MNFKTYGGNSLKPRVPLKSRSCLPGPHFRTLASSDVQRCAVKILAGTPSLAMRCPNTWRHQRLRSAPNLPGASPEVGKCDRKPLPRSKSTRSLYNCSHRAAPSPQTAHQSSNVRTATVKDYNLGLCAVHSESPNVPDRCVPFQGHAEKVDPNAMQYAEMKR